ncbi:hypothetical protein [Nitrosomonas sp. Is79A3]
MPNAPVPGASAYGRIVQHREYMKDTHELSARETYPQQFNVLKTHG